MCYSFEFLRDVYTAGHFRSRVEQFFREGPDGWPCWSFSNHDVVRHVTRWGAHGGEPMALGRQAAALLLSLRGSACIYQGEELGLPEADIDFEELTDPPGIRFWPEYKGRDGCRTPIPWEEGPAPNGFSTAKPWLPVKPPHEGLNVARQEADPESMLNYYRRLLALRRERAELVDGDIAFLRTAEPVLAFRRSRGDATTLCVYNLSKQPRRLTMKGRGRMDFWQAAEVEGRTLTLGPSGFAWFAQEQGGAPFRVGHAADAERE
jgi:alpha-glucosidase